ncbi:MAG: hypothetical protein AAF639_44275 [Chloroflexota bacterium]
MYIRRNIKVFILSSIAVSVATWNIAFTLGVYNAIFFDKLFTIWVVNIAVLLACLALPKEERPIPPLGMVALATPSIWLFLGAVQVRQSEWSWLDNLLYLSSILLMVLCLPYVVYVIASLTQEEALRVRPRRLLYALIGIAIVMSSMGFFMGRYNKHFLTCRDFEVAGWFKPINCFDGNFIFLAVCRRTPTLI